MIGSFISDDYYFFFDSTTLYWLRCNHTRIGSFVCYDNKPSSLGNGKLILMPLYVKIDNDTKEKPSSSSIDIDFLTKECSLTIGVVDFNNWFVTPDEHIKLHGPNWRFASCNVYIKTETSYDSETFKNNILNFIRQVPEKRHPINHKMIRELKSQIKQKRKAKNLP